MGGAGGACGLCVSPPPWFWRPRLPQARQSDPSLTNSRRCSGLVGQEVYISSRGLCHGPSLERTIGQHANLKLKGGPQRIDWTAVLCSRDQLCLLAS